MSTLANKVALLKPVLVFTQAVMENLPDQTTDDPEGLHESVTKGNEMSLRVARTFFSWICQSVNDPVMWSKPPEGVSQVEMLTLSATMAAGLIVNFPDELPLDTATLDPKVIQHSSAAWRIWRTCHSWLCAAIVDDAMFVPAPDLGGTPAESGGLGLEGLKKLLPLAMADNVIVDMIKKKFLGG